MTVTRSTHHRTTHTRHHTTHGTHSTHGTHARTHGRKTGHTGRTHQAGASGPTRPARGANPKLAAAVKSINIQQYHARGRTTFCNQAFNAYAKKMGYRGMEGLVANQMYTKMNAPGSGWKKVSAQEAIQAAKDGKLVAASWYNSRSMAGRPDGKAPGHVAAVIGEYAPGVPGIAQAGRNTFEWGPVTASRKNPTYFVRE